MDLTTAVNHFSPVPLTPPPSRSRTLPTQLSFSSTNQLGFKSLHCHPVSSSVYTNVRTSLMITANHFGRMIVPNASYAAPIDSSSGASYMLRPLAEILRDMNKRVPDQVLKPRPGSVDDQKYIPWYQANRMLSFYAPGWCGEVRSIIFSADGKFVTVIYRVTLRGSDGEAYREASGTASTQDTESGDPTQRAEATAFSRACARFGLGLYLHHEPDAQ